MAESSGVVTIGNFDGVHLGHQALLREVVERARARGVAAVAVTFDPHPEMVLFPDRPLTALCGPDEKEALIRAAGVDDVWVCPFTTELSRLEPEQFLALVAARRPIHELWVGSDFALGRGRAGTVAVLAAIGAEHGWGLHVVPPVRVDGRVVSSTAIRTRLAEGAMPEVAALLGRPFTLEGAVDSDGVLAVPPRRALPRPGTYPVLLRQGALPRPATAHVEPGAVRIPAAQPGPARVTFAPAD